MTYRLGYPSSEKKKIMMKTLFWGLIINAIFLNGLLQKLTDTYVKQYCVEFLGRSLRSRKLSKLSLQAKSDDNRSVIPLRGFFWSQMIFQVRSTVLLSLLGCSVQCPPHQLKELYILPFFFRNEADDLVINWAASASSILWPEHIVSLLKIIAIGLLVLRKVFLVLLFWANKKKRRQHTG